MLYFNSVKRYKSPFGNIAIMVAEVKEQYGALEEPLGIIMDHIKNFNHYSFKGINFVVDFRHWSRFEISFRSKWT